MLRRDMVLDSVHDLLVERSWSSITLADVARVSGVSRQLIYKEFGSRLGLAQGYGLRLADRFVDAISDVMEENVGDVYTAFLHGFRGFFAGAASDPLVMSLHTGAAKPDLLKIVTVDSGPIIARSSQRLTAILTQGWVKIAEEDAGVVARTVVRLAISYVSMPPESNYDVAADLARLMASFIERYGVIETRRGAAEPPTDV